MDTNNGKLLAKEEVFQIVGCAIEVLNALGHGLVEKQPLFDILYKGHKVGLFIPDLIAFNAVVLDGYP
jgi:hypothetical protein